MTDTAPQKEPTKSEADKLQKLADAYAKDRTKEPGYAYRFVTSGGVTRPVVTKIEKKG